ncbi:MAG: acylphosphatase [Anaerolineales bacterium]|nr:acylphosphatase [Anaerolineales bacterium]
MNEKERLHAQVYGEVQGVGFRAFVVRRAMTCGVTGWVRNRWDGSVELTAEGPRPALESLMADVRQGPSASVVERVEAEWGPATGEFRIFGVR